MRARAGRGTHLHSQPSGPCGPSSDTARVVEVLVVAALRSRPMLGGGPGTHTHILAPDSPIPARLPPLTLGYGIREGCPAAQRAAGRGLCWDRPGRRRAPLPGSPVPPGPACPCQPLQGQNRHTRSSHCAPGTGERLLGISAITLTVSIISLCKCGKRATERHRILY